MEQNTNKNEKPEEKNKNQVFLLPLSPTPRYPISLPRDHHVTALLWTDWVSSDNCILSKLFFQPLPLIADHANYNQAKT